MERATDHVYAMASNAEASVAFYRDALELPATTRSDRSAAFDTRGRALAVEQEFDGEPLAGYGLPVPGENRGDGVVVIAVDDGGAVQERTTDSQADVRRNRGTPSDSSWRIPTGPSSNYLDRSTMSRTSQGNPVVRGSDDGT